MAYQVFEVLGMSRQHTLTHEGASATIVFDLCPNKEIWDEYKQDIGDYDNNVAVGKFELNVYSGEPLEGYNANVVFADNADRVWLRLLPEIIPPVHVSYNLMNNCDYSANQPPPYSLMSLERVVVKELADNDKQTPMKHIRVTCTYGTSRNINFVMVGMQQTTERRRITQSLQSDDAGRTAGPSWAVGVPPYDPPPDSGFAIGATQDSVKGADVLRNSMELTMVVWYKSNELYSSNDGNGDGIIQQIGSLDPFVNEKPFLRWDAREVLFKNISAPDIPLRLEQDNDGIRVVSDPGTFHYVPVRFNFLIGKNPISIGEGASEPGYDDGLPVTTNATAHDYIDYRYAPKVSEEDIIMGPQYRRVHIVYKTRDFYETLQFPCLVGNPGFDPIDPPTS